MNKIRFGLIGYGAWGSHHARAIAESPHAELAAIAARSPENQAAARAKHPDAEDRTFQPTFSLKHHHGETVRDIPITKMTGEVYELVDEISAFAAAIRNRAPQPATGEDRKWSVAMCLKAQESVNTGCVVSF